MKIVVNVCLTGPYSDGFTYQDNLLSKHFVKNGYKTYLLAPNYCWGEDGSLRRVDEGSYVDENGVHVIRISPKGGKSVSSRLRRYDNLQAILNEIKPDVIFIHGLQFLDCSVFCRYAELHRDVRLFVDNHADYYNSAQNFLSKYLLHRILWKRNARRLVKRTEMFWGVTPNACSFLKNEYSIPENVIGCLPLGTDDIASPSDWPLLREDIRTRYNISPEEFVVVSGGKLTKEKNVSSLVKAVKSVANRNVRLLLFGSIDPAVEDELDLESEFVTYVGWIGGNEVQNYLIASDLAVFPGSQSALWLQTISCGLPGLFKKVDGGNPVDVGGNCMYLKKADEFEIAEAISKILDDKDMYDAMKSAAMEHRNFYAYSRLASVALLEEGFER